jgi:hypothetical protein
MKNPCWLKCGELAVGPEQPVSDGLYVMECPACGKYAISQRAVVTSGTLTPEQLDGLKQRARLETAAGGVLQIGAANIVALAFEGARIKPSK